MPGKKTPPAFSMDPIDIHVLQRDAAANDRKKRLAIEAMSPDQQKRFSAMSKEEQEKMLGGQGLPDPGRPGGPMDAMAPGTKPKVAKGPKAIEPEDKK
jgi:hypothetical protein